MAGIIGRVPTYEDDMSKCANGVPLQLLQRTILECTVCAAQHWILNISVCLCHKKKKQKKTAFCCVAGAHGSILRARCRPFQKLHTCASDRAHQQPRKSIMLSFLPLHNSRNLGFTSKKIQRCFDTRHLSLTHTASSLLCLPTSCSCHDFSSMQEVLGRVPAVGRRNLRRTTGKSEQAFSNFLHLFLHHSAHTISFPLSFLRPKHITSRCVGGAEVGMDVQVQLLRQHAHPQLMASATNCLGSSYYHWNGEEEILAFPPKKTVFFFPSFFFSSFLFRPALRHGIWRRRLPHCRPSIVIVATA